MDAVEAIPATTRFSSESQAPRKTRPSFRWLLPWLFVAPALFIYVVVVVYPMVFSVYLSFFRWDGIAPTKAFIGLQNYVALFASDPVFWIALTNNAIWLVAALILPTSIGLTLALILNSKFRGSRIFRTIFYIPAVLSLAVVGLIWTWMYLLGIPALRITFSTASWLPALKSRPEFCSSQWQRLRSLTCHSSGRTESSFLS